PALFAGNAKERALGVTLTTLFPDDALLPLLEPALADPDAEVRRRALHALPLQIRTPAWEALLERQSASPDPAVHAAATALLAERRADLARPR
ncbi:MAG TPA: HEAT repeat domain-containing protein, partial [Longimicrobiaceae bacterium]|nr:HEAT repeat domain-containing protein [Longimicrobiaceae bacterium]